MKGGLLVGASRAASAAAVARVTANACMASASAPAPYWSGPAQPAGPSRAPCPGLPVHAAATRCDETRKSDNEEADSFIQIKLHKGVAATTPRGPADPPAQTHLHINPIAQTEECQTGAILLYEANRNRKINNKNGPRNQNYKIIC